MKPKRCKDCVAEGVTTKRDAKYAGPRCTTHHRQRKAAERDRRHGLHIEKHFDLTEEEYQIVLAFQGGTCAGCQRARGIRKRMPVEHDHKTLLLRGIVCGTCNLVLGRMRDDAAALRRLADMLENSTVTAALGEERYAPQNRDSGWRRRR